MSIKLVRVKPEKIMEYWYQIRECIVAALPSYVEPSEANFLKIQENLLTDSLQCWIASDEEQIYGVATTRFTRDETSGQKNLLVYTIAIIQDYPDSLWKDSLNILGKYAVANGCRGILAFSDHPRVLEIAKSIGADVETRLIRFIL